MPPEHGKGVFEEAGQDLVVVPFKAGGLSFGYPSLAIMPANAAFFALTLVDLQGWVTFEELGPYTPRSILYVTAPSAPKAQTPAEALVKSEGCQSCHTK